MENGRQKIVRRSVRQAVHQKRKSCVLEKATFLAPSNRYMAALRYHGSLSPVNNLSIYSGISSVGVPGMILPRPTFPFQGSLGEGFWCKL